MNYSVFTIFGFLVSLILATVAPRPGWAVGAVDDVMEWSLERLLEVKVKKISLVSRSAAKVDATPAAVYVLGRDEILRSGAANVAEALRLVPGLHVGRLDAHTWAIGARGFNIQLANKMLVQIDGRSVYSSTLSGVLWELQDVPLDEIERIEAVRGPGGTLWGVNAVNGIINVVTRPAGETPGGKIRLVSGTEERATVGWRYGGRLGKAHYRIYGQGVQRAAAARLGGGSNDDGWSLLRAGFRSDWDRGRDGLMLQGNIYLASLRSHIGQYSRQAPYLIPKRVDSRPHGEYLLGRWERRFSSVADMALQAFVDRAFNQVNEVAEMRTTWDVDFQHRFLPRRRHEVTWGLGGRLVDSEVDSSFGIEVKPRGEVVSLASAFVQDKVGLVPRKLSLTFGTKLEYTDPTGLALQPSLRAMWQVSQRHGVWAAATRAIRTPSRGEQDGRVMVNNLPLGAAIDGPQLFFAFRGAGRLKNERLNALELGYRYRGSGQRLRFDLTSFLHAYDRLGSIGAISAADTTTIAPHSLVFLELESVGNITTFGFEADADWTLSQAWRFNAAYAYLAVGDRGNSSAPVIAPVHQGWIGAHGDLGQRWSVDATLRAVGELRDETDPTRGEAVEVGAYAELDLRLAYRFAGGSELFVVGQNLLREDHLEMVPVGLRAELARIERGVYLGCSWKIR